MGYAIVFIVGASTALWQGYNSTFHPGHGAGYSVVGIVSGVSSFLLMGMAIIGLISWGPRSARAIHVVLLGAVLFIVEAELLSIRAQVGFLEVLGTVVSAAFIALVLDQRKPDALGPATRKRGGAPARR